MVNGRLQLPHGYSLDEGDTQFIPVQGTWAWRDRAFAMIARALTLPEPHEGLRLAANEITSAPIWWEEGSPWTAYMKTHGLCVLDPQDPFTWSTRLEGLPGWFSKLRIGDDAKHRDWQAGGLALKWYTKGRPFEDLNVVAHSHGLQVVLYAMAYGVRFRNVISIGSPVRTDMVPAMQWAKEHKRFVFWAHVYDTRGDRVQEWGEWFEGGEIADFPNFPKGACPFASVSVGIPGVQHSNILYNPDWFEQWSANRLVDVLRIHEGERS